jgi:hypothetical protein
MPGAHTVTSLQCNLTTALLHSGSDTVSSRKHCVNRTGCAVCCAAGTRCTVSGAQTPHPWSTSSPGPAAPCRGTPMQQHPSPCRTPWQVGRPSSTWSVSVAPASLRQGSVADPHSRAAQLQGVTPVVRRRLCVLTQRHHPVCMHVCAGIGFAAGMPLCPELMALFKAPAEAAAAAEKTGADKGRGHHPSSPEVNNSTGGCAVVCWSPCCRLLANEVCDSQPESRLRLRAAQTQCTPSFWLEADCRTGRYSWPTTSGTPVHVLQNGHANTPLCFPHPMISQPLPCPSPAGEGSLPGMLPRSHKLPLDLHTPEHDEDMMLHQVRPACGGGCLLAGCMGSTVLVAARGCEWDSWAWWPLSSKRLCCHANRLHTGAVTCYIRRVLRCAAVCCA